MKEHGWSPVQKKNDEPTSYTETVRVIKTECEPLNRVIFVSSH